MQVEKVGNQIQVTMDASESMMITIKEAGTERVARAFLTVKEGKRGPTFKLVTKKNDFRDEVLRSALAHFDNLPGR